MKNKLTQKTHKGFTLIEVVIVLAIGALIILVVLNAVGSARRNQRDSTRRTEASDISAALEQYAANNSMRYPSSEADVQSDIISSDYVSNSISSKWQAAGGDCSSVTVGAEDYLYHYVPGASNLSYDLEVCLEAGESTTIQDTN